MEREKNPKLIQKGIKIVKKGHKKDKKKDKDWIKDETKDIIKTKNETWKKLAETEKEQVTARRNIIFKKWKLLNKTTTNKDRMELTEAIEQYEAKEEQPAEEIA